MVLEARKKKKEQVQNTQTLKSRGKGCKKKKIGSFKNMNSLAS